MKTYETETTTAQDEDENEDKEDNRTLETARFEVLPKCFYLSVDRRSSKKGELFYRTLKKGECDSLVFRSASRSFEICE